MKISAVGVGFAALFAALAWGGRGDAQTPPPRVAPDAEPPAVSTPARTGAASSPPASDSSGKPVGSAAANKRIGLVYAPSFATRLADKGLTSHNVGAELALGGGDLRYHLTAAFSRASISFSTLGTLHVPYSGLRLEPATFGIAIPVVKRPGLRLEVEPTLMALSGSVLVRGGEGVFLFSTGGDVRANVALGKLFLSASPLGFEVLFATVSDGFLQVGAAFHYRTRVSAGIEF